MYFYIGRPIARVLLPLLLLLACQAGAVTSTPPVELQGDLKQGGIVFGQVSSGSQVWVGDRQLRLTDGGKFVFGLDRDAPKEIRLRVVDASGATHQAKYEVAQREYNIQRIEGVQQKHVSPPAEVLSRISSEAAKVRQARELNDSREDFLHDFIWPLQGPITGVYGSQRVYNGTPKSPHYGIDIAGPVGAIVKAPAPGVVTLAEADLYYSGGTLIVDHGYGLSSTFIHLHKVLVKVGQVVEQGQAIAEVGATGRVTGPHLDWRMNWFDVRVDPQLLMQGRGMNDN